MERPALVDTELTTERLFLPFGPHVALQSTYYLAGRQAAAQHPVVAAFPEWLPGRAVRQKRV